MQEGDRGVGWGEWRPKGGARGWEGARRGTRARQNWSWRGLGRRLHSAQLDCASPGHLPAACGARPGPLSPCTWAAELPQGACRGELPSMDATHLCRAARGGPSATSARGGHGPQAWLRACKKWAGKAHGVVCSDARTTFTEGGRRNSFTTRHLVSFLEFCVESTKDQLSRLYVRQTHAP